MILDTRVTDDLEQEGIARDAVRAVQEARKQAGLDVSDRIVLSLNVGPEYADALLAHASLIADETLSEGFAVRAMEAMDAAMDNLYSPGDGVHVTAARALGTEKAPIVMTIDSTATVGSAEEVDE